jgi:NAD(P)H-dependent flavin oxidoreductase YrpB (nitropropane dioxygenase family)
MRTPICDVLGIDYPIFAFTPSPAVAAAVTRAGGFGVLGAIRYTDPAQLDAALSWIDENVDGKPYGVDVVIPKNVEGGTASVSQIEEMIPPQHRSFVESVLAGFGVAELPQEERAAGITGWMHSHGRAQVEVSLRHPVRLIANALGSPPPDVIDQAHAHGVLVAALAGKPKHALAHKAAGVDIVVAQGHEAGGHCGEITTMVLVPEIAAAVSPLPVLAAGGIGTGGQIAAALALGAQGAWMGSVWLTATEFQEEPATETGYSVVQNKLLAASSGDTVRSRVISGKPARMLRTPWTEAWAVGQTPDPLPMPLQGLLVADAEARIRHHQNRDLLGSPVGQIVGQMNEIVPAGDTIQRLVAEFHVALDRLQTFAR